MSALTPNKIVAVVLYYNGAETLFQVIEGIKSQTLSVEKVVVIDNASDVDLSGRFSDDVRVNFIRLNTNGGWAPVIITDGKLLWMI